MNVSPMFANNLQSLNYFPSFGRDNEKYEADGKSDISRHSKSEGVNIQLSSESKKLLNDQIINALDKKIAQPNSASLYQLDADNFTPEKISDRILSYVGASLSNPPVANKAELSDRLHQAKEGIKKGFNDAKDVLKEFGLFDGAIKKDIEKTYQLLKTGLEKLAANITSDASPVKEAPVYQREMAVEKSFSLKQSFDFELTTKDGDKVKINVNKLDTSYESGYIKSSGHQISAGYSMEKLSQSGYSISVEGNLDKDELDAIDSLLGKMANVANKYFSGDNQAAMAQLTGLGYDTSEIASFSLELKEVQQTRAVAAYQQVASDPVSNAKDIGKLMKPLKEYAAQLDESKREYANNKLFEKSGERFQQLLDQIAKANEVFNSVAGLEQFSAYNRYLINDISSSGFVPAASGRELSSNHSGSLE